MADLSKVTPGADLVIPAAAYNAFVDAAIATRGNQGGGGPNTPTGGDTPAVFRAKNNDGAGLSRFDAVVVTSPVLTPTTNLNDFKDSFAPKVAKCSAANYKGSWGVMLDATPDQGYGRCCVDGVTVAWINVKTVSDAAVEIVSGSKIPISNPAGSAQILWVAGGVGSATATGNQWAVIRLGGGVGIPAIEYGKVTTIFGGVNFQLDARPCDAAGNFLHSDSAIVVRLFWAGPMTWAVDDVVQFVRFGKLNGIIFRKGNSFTGGFVPDCVVKISGNAAGGGKYTGFVSNEVTADVSASTGLLSSQFASGTNAILILNLCEVDLNVHNIAAGTFHLGRALWRNADGTLVVAIEAAFKVPSLSSNPTGVAGQIIFNNGTGHFMGYNGSAWVQLDN